MVCPRKIGVFLSLVCIGSACWMFISQVGEAASANAARSDVQATAARISKLPGGPEILENSGENQKKNFLDSMDAAINHGRKSREAHAWVLFLSGAICWSAIVAGKKR